jgi:hypothetical protein
LARTDIDQHGKDGELQHRLSFLQMFQPFRCDRAFALLQQVLSFGSCVDKGCCNAPNLFRRGRILNDGSRIHPEAPCTQTRTIDETPNI